MVKKSPQKTVEEGCVLPWSCKALEAWWTGLGGLSVGAVAAVLIYPTPQAPWKGFSVGLLFLLRPCHPSHSIAGTELQNG